MSTPRFTLRLAKGDFKFSAAHFTLFSPTEAEPLHGHNYRVLVEVGGDRLDDLGLLIETGILKRRIRELLAGLDDRVLLPERSPLLALTIDGGAVDCRYSDRAYRFPEREVVLLPLVNVTMELLARLVWRRLAEDLDAGVATHLAVEIEETDGQSCRYAAPLGAEG
jgi:6-pyruvoyltetrahydropterin/6-carboxytetrahydropterin synthase